jgi:hypothetical protein
MAEVILTGYEIARAIKNSGKLPELVSAVRFEHDHFIFSFGMMFISKDVPVFFDRFSENSVYGHYRVFPGLDQIFRQFLDYRDGELIIEGENIIISLERVLAEKAAGIKIDKIEQDGDRFILSFALPF